MQFNFFKKLFRELGRLRKSQGLRSFVAHNRAVFPGTHSRSTGKSVVLFEFNAMQSAHIAYSYLANVLAEDSGSRIKGHLQKMHQTWRQKLFFRIRKLIGGNEFAAFKSFGATDVVEIVLSSAQKARAAILFDEVWTRLHTRRDIEELTINTFWIGDLVYDSYLMTYKKPTIDKDMPEFKSSLRGSIESFVFWEDYFNTNDVRAINVSHCVYNLAIPLRIAVQRDIPVFQTNATHVYRLSSKNLFAYNDFVNFPERFAALPQDVREAGMAEAQRRIERRFAGEVGVDMAYSTKSAYGASRHQRLIQASPRKKILIATHCFFDSPHSYGNNLFPDFYEWLEFLGKISECTDYDWYIKTHPDYLPGTREVIDGFLARFPKFTLLPADASHHQIIAEGIDFALTVYGTIAFEYAALGIPVINASLYNPHIAYDFNLHAKDVEDYRQLLMKLDQLTFSIDKQQVYEYYFMRHIFNTENLFFDSYSATIAELGGYDRQFTPDVYEKWLEEWRPEKHQAILAAVRNFVQSGDFRMDYRHYGREFTVESIGERA
jgi:hypothetical protein